MLNWLIWLVLIAVVNVAAVANSAAAAIGFEPAVVEHYEKKEKSNKDFDLDIDN